MERYHIDYTDEAIANLSNIGNFIALDSPARAESFIDELAAYIDSLLSIFPYAATEKFPKFPGVRKLPYRHYNIFYRIVEDDKRVEILHIYNAAVRAPYDD